MHIRNTMRLKSSLSMCGCSFVKYTRTRSPGTRSLLSSRSLSVSGVDLGNAPSGGPLEGVRVCDLTSMTAGSYCTMVLGDLGADIIKVEDTMDGDVSRGWGPPFIGTESTYYLSMNRNKRSISVDISMLEGRDVVHDLVRNSDVLVESCSPGYLDSLGLGYENLSVINPSVVYCSISGYGTSGPIHKAPPDSAVVAALSGFMSITGPENGPDDGPACVVGKPITEIITAVHACGAINAALYERRSTQQGKLIETSLLQTQVSYLSHIMASYLNSGIVGRKYGTAHSSIVPYQAFRTADKQIIIAAGSDDQFHKTCKVLSLEELSSDERFITNAQRVIHREELLGIMDQVLVTRSSQCWLRELEDNGVPCAPVNSVGEVFAMDQVGALDLVQEVDHPGLGSVKLTGSAMDFDGVSLLRKTLHPPALGEHTGEILRNVLKYSDKEYQTLLENGVVKCAHRTAKKSSS